MPLDRSSRLVADPASPRAPRPRPSAVRAGPRAGCLTSSRAGCVPSPRGRTATGWRVRAGRLRGVSTCVLVPGLLRGRPARGRGCVGRAALNVAQAAYLHGVAPRCSSPSSRHGGAGALVALTAVDGATGARAAARRVLADDAEPRALAARSRCLRGRGRGSRSGSAPGLSVLPLSRPRKRTELAPGEARLRVAALDRDPLAAARAGAVAAACAPLRRQTRLRWRNFWTLTVTRAGSLSR